MKTTKKGFTLIELMIVVAIIGILAAIAIPKFADLINKSKEGATKAGLSSVRSALQVYYGDTEGRFPAYAGTAGTVLNVLTNNGKYLSEIPLAKLPTTGIADSRAVIEVLDASKATTAFSAGGGWYYYNDDTTNSTWGNIVVNCTKEDIKNAFLTAESEPGHVFTAWSTF